MVTDADLTLSEVISTIYQNTRNMVYASAVQFGM